MKTSFKISLLLSAAAALTMAACGKFEKNPVPDLDTYRAQGSAHINDPYSEPTPITKYVIQEKNGTETTNTVRVVSRDDVQLSITDNKDYGTTLQFEVGKPKTYHIHLALTAKELQDPSCKFEVVPQNAPSDATFILDPAHPESGDYAFTWTPPVDPSDSIWGSDDLVPVTFVVNLKAGPAAIKQKFDGIIHSLQVALIPKRSSNQNSAPGKARTDAALTAVQASGAASKPVAGTNSSNKTVPTTAATPAAQGT